jgi:hypothetical protein
MNTNQLSSNLTDSAEIELGDDILGINGPVDIPSGWEWLWWTLGILALAALVFYLTKKFLGRVKVVRAPVVPRIPPHTVARRKLSEAMRWIGDPYRFCTAVSDALREYLERQFDLHSPERTTDEFLDELRHDESLNRTQKDLVAGFLNECDLVKFAKENPTQDQLEKLHRTALSLVEETMVGGATDPTAPKEEVRS